jgi:hypothetical protein
VVSSHRVEAEVRDLIAAFPRSKMLGNQESELVDLAAGIIRIGYQKPYDVDKTDSEMAAQLKKLKVDIRFVCKDTASHMTYVCKKLGRKCDLNPDGNLGSNAAGRRAAAAAEAGSGPKKARVEQPE